VKKKKQKEGRKRFISTFQPLHRRFISTFPRDSLTHSVHIHTVDYDPFIKRQLALRD
jgi:hypothetical protein